MNLLTMTAKVKTTFLLLISFCVAVLLFRYDYNFQEFTVLILASFLVLMGYADSGKNVFKSFGFRNKGVSIKNLLIYAPATGLCILLFYIFVMVPIVTHFTKIPLDISDFDILKGNTPILVSTLIFVWISAALGEEIIFRGYFMTRFSKIFGTQILSTLVNIIFFGVFFGLIHAYQGITGQILSGITGAIIATIFHLRKNDLWFCIVVHGTIDTLAIIGIYLSIIP